MLDLIIVGGGPAGAAAAVYAARKQLKTLLVTPEWGGQSIVSPDIHNWIGTPSISGDDLAKQLKAHVESVADTFLETKTPAKATDLAVRDDGATVTLEDGTTHETRAVLVATGGSRRKLEVPGAEEFDQKGLTYCASCDGPLFAGLDVVVIGGGNAGFEAAAQLLAYAKSVTMLQRRDVFKADATTVEKVLANPKMTAHTNAVPTEVLGDKMVTGLKWKNTETGEEHELSIGGVFVEIGMIPNTAWVADAVELNENHKIKVDPMTQQTSHHCVWAAGDCTDGLYHQNNIAAGDAVKALENIYAALSAR